MKAGYIRRTGSAEAEQQPHATEAVSDGAAHSTRSGSSRQDGRARVRVCLWLDGGVWDGVEAKGGGQYRSITVANTSSGACGVTDAMWDRS